MTEQQILEILIRQIHEVEPELKDREISGTDRLRDLGLDSMQRVEVLMLTQEELDISVPRTELAQPACLREVAQLFLQHGPGSE